MSKPLDRELVDEHFAAMMDRFEDVLYIDKQMVARHHRRIERAQLEELGIKRTRELHAHGLLFGMTIKGDAITVYVEDDENWHPVTSFHRDWLRDLGETVENMVAHLKAADDV